MSEELNTTLRAMEKAAQEVLDEILNEINKIEETITRMEGK